MKREELHQPAEPIQLNPLIPYPAFLLAVLIFTVAVAIAAISIAEIRKLGC